MFQSIELYWLRENGKARRCAEEAARFLEGRGVKVLLPGRAPGSGSPDLMLSFGGDGTLLTAAGMAVQADIPLMGINLGTVGFLTEEEPEQLSTVLEKILGGEYFIERRSLLETLLPERGFSAFSLNDVVVSRGGFARLIRINCTVNGEEYGLFTADGIIVATPTGSTGYSLSAGGPIVEPDTDCMIITPICAHSLQHRSSVISSRSEIRLQLLKDRPQSGVLQIDGQNRADLHAGEEIIVRSAAPKVKLLRIHPYRFFSLIRQKLNEWGTTA